ncbi:MAG TPA: helix-hairpin-helix domain-containing protein [Halothiobacillaceae bacterium]|nr:helix-hairpin-helix domain-containing protein [Halothiobacillaceae bacterium]
MQLNINEASAAELTQLNGIGETYAERIVAYREENGRFENIDEIMEVRGIGPATFEKIRGDIVTE